ncbi:Flagellar motor rotation protein MotB [Fulvivirga imtechensis AK7]|uniref:Flagellar motor rotation protein MotB n=1 Tax=Fulvivirga imtechensis AK7 TaxID=1237149 RepID=L8K245_9BACT|nr:OmpA family protein [Fulvivirga imtechensis]ELR73527.1 Flagellar motor rotation protein MotB [Fulvivirga imtechensis AK7]
MRTLIGLTILLFATACVTQKKYDDLMSEKIQLESDLAMCKDSLESATANVGRLSSLVDQLKSDTSRLGRRIRNNELEMAELTKEHKQLEAYYNNLLNNSGKLTRDLAEQQEHLLALKENLEQTKRLNESLSADLSEREKKVKELETILENKEKAVQELKNRITNALLSFKENDLTVEVKNGKVYVSLAEQLLFKSGSTVVDSKGVTALQQLAKALKGQKDIHVMVEGHTDNVPISRTSTYMKDNWDLSVLRATSIIRILTESGVGPEQITAAGRGEFAPVATNDSAGGKQKNRRTEIIITPDLDELFKILETN